MRGGKKKKEGEDSETLGDRGVNRKNVSSVYPAGMMHRVL